MTIPLRRTRMSPVGSLPAWSASKLLANRRKLAYFGPDLFNLPVPTSWGDEEVQDTQPDPD